MSAVARDIHPIFVNRMKTNAAEICKGIVPSDCFVRDFDRYADPLCRWLVGYDLDKDSMAHLCPCLYEPRKRIEGDTLFRTPAAVKGSKILICILWRASALSTKKFQTKMTYGGLWNITEVTPAAMTYAAIMLCFLPSGNPIFTTDRGAKSKINYFSNFEFYVSTIEKKLAKGSRSMLATVRFYNEQVFPTSQHVALAVPTVKANLEENSEEEEILRALDDIDAEMDSDESDFDSALPIVTAHNPNHEASAQAVPAPIVGSVGEIPPVPLVQSRVMASNEKRGRKQASSGVEAPAHRSAHGQGLPVQSDMEVPVPAPVEKVTRHGQGLQVDRVEDEEEEASESEGNGNDDEEEEEEEEEEDLEYAH
ncbi:uncharacterized protein EV420DRAFT_1753458 [Desarmillaria tabescens]|uniref:Uncharacterized protein n=1 Tax=Armillaria tabescens TaxID=1929756 RepID=A0AA39J7H9_ARMTA|nr:uncharacterized protein EV420DRAFT_1753458 [Desarmillaria tabescens]KAK0437587.1 hypothetical protein EV420DRAFT_1753458 [Desarmillaria tabescens]